jgi:hypothetical protein
MKYNYIVVGGGISGLYVAYRLLQLGKGPVLVIEQSDRLGGRVFTYTDSLMSVETGAGRFKATHHNVIQLLKELGLYSRATKNSDKVIHYRIDDSGVSRRLQSILDYDSTRSSVTPFDITLDAAFDSISGVSLPNVGIVARILAAGAIYSRAALQSMTFIDFAKQVVSAEDVDFLLGSFGYYSELVLMNAYDCMNLMMELNPDQAFFSLRGGLSLIIDELAGRIRSMGGTILLKKTVQRIHDKYIVSGKGIRGGAFEFSANGVVCAVTKNALDGIVGLRAIVPKGLLSAPLCRVYAKYSTKHLWFRGMSKMTVNNELRMVIPVSEKEGVIMITYTDNKFAKFWKRVLDKQGERGLELEIKRKMYEAIGIWIPDAEEIRLFYWDYGVGYWGVGINSDEVSDRITQPFPDKSLFICGENFSNRYQQWMEGALETGERVIDKIVGKGKI